MGLARAVYRIAAGLVTVAALVPNVRLYRGGTDQSGVAPDVLPQLRFVGGALREGAGKRMQGLFPEGFFFSHALYGMAWVEVGQRQAPGSALHERALREARWALGRLDSPQGRGPFPAELDPPHGVFYVGWSSWLRGGVIGLQPPGQRDRDEVSRFVADCEALGKALDSSETPFLQAYHAQAWPVDSTVAVAALRLHDALLPDRFDAAIATWLKEAKARLDPATGLLPHRVDPRTGEAVDGARGSSQSVIARFLVEIDPDWGRQQYELFRRQFVGRLLGAPGVREYPTGVAGGGDVDSGPLIGGISASATVVTVGAALVHGDRELADPLLQTIEAFGTPVSWRGAKRYNCGLLPVGDAFLVWSKTARPWVARPPAASLPPPVGRWWRAPVHALSLVAIVLLWAPMLWRRK
jgi:hypothetical protein